MSFNYYLPCEVHKRNANNTIAGIKIPLKIILGNDDWCFNDFIFDAIPVFELENGQLIVEIIVLTNVFVIREQEFVVIKLPTGQMYIVYWKDIIKIEVHN